MAAIAGFVFAAVSSVVLIAWFTRLERVEDRHTIVVVAFWVLLVEAVLAGQSANTPIGILRPAFGGQDFRPPDIVIVAALIARVGSHRRILFPASILAWLAFVGLYVTQTYVGLFVEGIPSSVVLFQAKAMFYILGGIVIGTGIDQRRAGAQFSRIAPWLAGGVLFALALKIAGIAWNIATPVQNFRGLGKLSNDTVTLIVVIGFTCLVCEAVRSRPRPLVMVSSVVLLLSPFAGTQRASYLVLGVLMVVVSVISLGATWKRRTNVTPTEVGVLLGAIVGIVALGFTLTPAPAELVSQVERSFFGQAEATSANARFDLLDQALVKIEEQPVFGGGVGTMVTRFEQRSGEDEPAAAHNLFLDLALRVGLVGVGVFSVAFGSALIRGGRRWADLDDDVEAAVLLAATLVLLAFFTKGMVEPAFEKFRLTMPLGLGVGIILATRAPERPPADPSVRRAGRDRAPV